MKCFFYKLVYVQKRQLIMTTITKAIKPWCQVCNTTKHHGSNCGKVIGYNAILHEFLRAILQDPYCDRVYPTAVQYEKQFLKYAIKFLRTNGCFEAESRTRVYADFEIKELNKASYRLLVSYFNTSLFQVRIKIREIKEQSNKCPICMDSMQNKKVCTTACGHKFCSGCYHAVLAKELTNKSEAKCPMCRCVQVSVY